jgi:arylsulfatase A-like enzyme
MRRTFRCRPASRYLDAYRGRFDEGWDVMRERRYKRLRELGLIDCDLAPMELAVLPLWNFNEAELRQRIGPGDVARAVPWNTLTEEQKKFQSMKMSIHAAMITRMDAEIGKVTDQLKAMGVFEDTVIVFLSDNGATGKRSFAETAMIGRPRLVRRRLF